MKGLKDAAYLVAGLLVLLSVWSWTITMDEATRQEDQQWRAQR